MADLLCVGDENCSFLMVIDAMGKAPTFEDIVDKWRKITLYLGIQDENRNIQQNILYEKWTATEVMEKILRSWRALKGTDAKLNVLLNTLKDVKLMDVLLAVQKKFDSNSDSSSLQFSSQLQAGVFLKMPTGLPQLLPGQVTTIPIQYGLTNEVDPKNDIGSSSNQSLYSITEDDLNARAVKDPKFTNVIVKIDNQKERKDDFYKLPGIQQGNGYALILNIIRYNDMDYRYGAQYDSLMLTQLFTQLGYEVIKYDDPHFFYTKKDVKRIVQLFRDYIEAKEPASVIVFVGCHGEMEQIVLSDKTLISLFTYVVYQFDADNCPLLKKVPKIFISNSSREIPTYHGAGFSNIFNTIICYATLPGNHSFRNMDQGSYYINSLVKVFAENACRLSLTELLELTQQDLFNAKISFPFGMTNTQQQQCMYVMLGGFGTFYFNM